MPSSLLFGINNEGRVFGLSTNGTKWREFVYLGLEFKQLSAVPHSLWAVGGDRQIYVHVHGLDIPIRVKEEAYENERWTPVHGFSSKLLPTDRYNFSTLDGTKNRALRKIKLPSMAWQWEGDWHIELSLGGEPLDHDGWTYAVDFPATFYAKKQWTSCVRRRRWVRYRRYSALNSWCAISPLHKDATQEPFIGISAGGHEAGYDGGRIAVWAVTAHGRLMFRTEVSATSPEGQRWNVIPTPGGVEVLQVAVGATGLVWACLQNGKALARTGITRDCITGNGWTEIAAPETNLSLIQISLGTNSLWAVTRDHRVWFRSGIRGELSGVSENLAKGSVWVEMIGRMASLSVSPNDQVFAIGESDRLLYFRTSVTQDMLTGKTWRQVGAPTQLSRTSSVASLFSAGSTVTPREKRHRSWTSLNRHSGSHDTARSELDSDGACHSAPTFTRPMAMSGTLTSLPPHASASTSGLPGSLPEEPDFPIHPVEIHEVKPRTMEPNDVYEDTSHPVVGFNMTKDQWMKKAPRAMSPLRSVGSIVGVEAHTEADSSVFEPEAMVGVYGEFGEREEEDDYLYWADSEAFWNGVEAGACVVDASHLPNWFAEVPGPNKEEFEKPWRLKILEELRHRLPVNITEEHSYEKAVDTSSWVKTADIKCLVGEVWREATLSLEWVEGDSGTDCGTLTISCPTVAVTYAQCSVAELNAVVRCSEPGLPRIGLHRGVETPPIKLQFTGEDDLEEWLAEFHDLCCHVRRLGNSPGPETLWLTTMLGDVHALDAADLQVEQQVSNKDRFKIEIPISNQALPITIPLYSGFTSGAELKIHGCVPDGADRFAFDLICDSADGDIAFHFNPRLVDECVVRNAKKNGVWGPEDRRGSQPFTMGAAFVLHLKCDETCARVAVDDKHFTIFNFRGVLEDDSALAPSSVTHLAISGDVNVTKVEYSALTPIFHSSGMFFRNVGGHLRKVESAGGVTWGIGYDSTAWYYVGGTGGPLLKGSQPGWNLPMVDSHTYYVYENQRWNPLTGYTSHGLPTDRHMWSDVTGRHKRTREKTKLLSRRWQWELDWAVDYTTPGEVDKEGWQYAVDFPASYHGTKHLTDYVRRRRWRRRARLVTTGPWRELGHTPLVDCCLHIAEGGEIVAWGSALNGDVLFRKGVSISCPAGLAWEHVSCDEPITSLSSSPGQLWGVGRSGGAFWRFDISAQNPIGASWQTVDAPKGVSLKCVSVGPAGVWALDTTGRLSVRKEVSRVFPSGSSWQTLPLYSGESAGEEGEAALPTTPLGVPSGGFRFINVGSRVWAITGSGRLLYRLNVNEENPAGSSWIHCIDAKLSHCSGL